MPRLKLVSAAVLLSLVAAAAVFPLAAASAGHRGCHCVVRMACCEDGTCTMDGDEAPATGPEWRTCRREVPEATTPIDPFDRALMGFREERDTRATGSIAALPADPPHFVTPIPTTPPPRSFSF